MAIVACLRQLLEHVVYGEVSEARLLQAQASPLCCFDWGTVIQCWLLLTLMAVLMRLTWWWGMATKSQKKSMSQAAATEGRGRAWAGGAQCF